MSYAVKMLGLLTDGLKKHERVECQGRFATFVKWSREEKVWAIRPTEGMDFQPLTTQMVVFCTGSHPRLLPFKDAPALAVFKGGGNGLITLETALSPQALLKKLKSKGDGPKTVGVIGASHSAVLVLKNLFELAQTTLPDLRVVWITRSREFKYAIQRDGWIQNDSTGLKGQAAVFAREHLEGDRLKNEPQSRFIRRVVSSEDPEGEEAVIAREVGNCDFLMQAIGFSRTRVPLDETHDLNGPPDFDASTGQLTHPSRKARGAEEVSKIPRKVIPGAFGAGIAFPERVCDPNGQLEDAVGLWKFMRHLLRVTPEWVSRVYGEKADDRKVRAFRRKPYVQRVSGPKKWD